MPGNIVLYLPETPEATGDLQQYEQLLKIYEALRLIAGKLDVAIDSIPGAGSGSGDITNGQNVGPTGANTAGVFAGKSGALLQFKRISGGGGLVISEDPTGISVVYNGVSSIASIGTGTPVYAGVVSGVAQFRKLLAGSGVTLAVTPGGDIQITATGGGGGSGNQEVFVGTPSPLPAYPSLIFTPITVDGQSVYSMQVTDGTP